MSELKEEWSAFFVFILNPIAVFSVTMLILFVWFMTRIEPPESRDYDPDFHRELFQECLAAASATSKAGHYNDNAEMVTTCSRISRSMAQDKYAEAREASE